MVPAAVVGAAVGLTATQLTIGVYIATIAINLAVSAILGKILAPKLGRDGREKGLQNIVKSNVAPRRVIYGECLVGGVLTYIQTTGEDNEFLHMIFSLAGHPIEDVLGIELEGEYINTSDANSELTVGQPLSSVFGSTLTIYKNKGWGYADLTYVTDPTIQKAQDDRFASDRINSNTNGDWLPPRQFTWSRDSQTGLYSESGYDDKLTNIPHVYMKFEFDRDIYSGFPQPKFHVKGKPLYNPQQDPTNFAAEGADSAGTHVLGDPDTYTYSDDWTLCVLDYLLNPDYGLQAKTSGPLIEIDWEEAISSYNSSSEIITNGLPSPDTATAPRYTVNGVFETNTAPIGIMEALLTSGAGELVYAQGQYKIRPGVYRPPASDNDIINENMILSPLSIQTHTPRSDLFNKAAGVFTDRGYDPSTAPNSTDNKPSFEPSDFQIVDPLDSSGNNPYEVEDGEEIIRDFDFPFTTNDFEAQRLARIQLERVRRGLTVSFEASLEVLKYSVGDTVYLEILSDSKYANESFFNKLGLDDTVQTRPNSPFTAYYKQFKIVDMQYTEEFKIAVTLLENAEEIYDWQEGYAQPSDNDLQSAIIFDNPTGVVSPPNFNVVSPDQTITEIVSGSDILTLIKWNAADRGSAVNAIDRAQTVSYILEYGIVDNPSQAQPADRVSTWISGGSFIVDDRTSIVQGPLSLTNIYIDPTTDYDFRIRSVVYSGRRSAWAYYSTDIGSDFSPQVPFGATRYYIKPTNGTIIKNSSGTLTVEAREVTSSGDTLLSSGNIKLFVGGTTEVTVANGYASPSDGYTGTFDAGDISNSVVVELRDGSGGTLLDTQSLVDVTDGATGQAVRTVNIYKLNDSNITDDTQGTFANPLSGMEAGWSLSVPSIVSDGDQVYVSTRTFTDDGASPQDPNWSTPTIYSERTDGIAIRTVNIYKLNDSNITDDTQGTFADPLSGMEAGWSLSVPSLISDGDIIYVSTRTFTEDASSPQDPNWSTPTIYAQRTDGAQGDPGPAGNDGRDATVIGSIRINVATFSASAGSNPGAMYVHGLDSSGTPADVAALAYYEGVQITIPAEDILTSQAVDQGYIIFDTAGGAGFTGASTSGNLAGARITQTGGTIQWQYDNDTAWTDFTPDADHIVIGRYRADVANSIYQATLTMPLTLTGEIVKADRIEATTISSISATVGSLETRPPGTASTPRLVLSDTAVPLRITDEQDATELFSLTSLGGGSSELALEGDFVAGSLDTAQAFSEAGITDLRGRLGLVEPGGTGLRGGTINIGPRVFVEDTSTNTPLDNPSPSEINSAANGDFLLTFRFIDNGQQSTSFTAGNWTVKWQYRVNAGTWTDVPSGSYTFSGTVTDLEIFPNPWSQSLDESRSMTWTTTATDNDTYEFRLNSIKNSGTSFNPKIETGQASQAITGSDIESNVENGTTVNATARWDGSLWVENTAIRHASDHIEIRSTAPTIWFYETDGAADNQNWYMGALSETFTGRAYNDGFTNSEVWLNVNRTGINIDSVVLSGDSVIHQVNGSNVYQTHANGFNVRDPSDQPYIGWLNSGGTRLAYMQAQTGTALRIENEQHGGAIVLAGEDLGGVDRAIFQGDPDGAVTLYHAGLTRFATFGSGVSVYGSLGNDPTTGGVQNAELNMVNSSGVEVGDINYLGTANLYVRNLVHGGNVEIQGQDSGGTTFTPAVFVPGGLARLRHGSTTRLETTSSGVTVYGNIAQGSTGTIAASFGDLSSTSGLAWMMQHGRLTSGLDLNTLTTENSRAIGLHGTHTNGPPNTNYGTLLQMRNSDTGSQLHIPRLAANPAFRGWSSSGTVWTSWYEFLTEVGGSFSGNFTLTGDWEFDGELHVDTATNTSPLVISRLGLTSESMRIGVNDNQAIFRHTQDETDGTPHLIVFNYTNNGAGNPSGSHYFDIQYEGASRHRFYMDNARSGYYMFGGTFRAYDTSSVNWFGMRHDGTNAHLDVSSGNLKIGETVDFESAQPQSVYGMGGDYSSTTPGTTWGATVWSLDTTWKGGSAGPNSVNTSVYGMRWLRGSHTNADSNVNEGLYIYQSGVQYGAIGTSGITTAGNNIRATGTAASLQLRERSALTGADAGYGRIWVLNEAPSELWYTDDNGTTYQVAGGAMREIFGTAKSADESVTESITLQNDDDLSLDCKAGFYYHVKLYLHTVESNILHTTGFKWDFTIPTSATGIYTWERVNGGNVTQTTVSDWTADQSWAANIGIIKIEGVIHTPNAGTLQLRWACATTTSGGAQDDFTTLKEGSIMTIIQAI